MNEQAVTTLPAEALPLPVSTELITPAQLLSVAVQRGDALDKLEKLMDLQERWEKKQAKIAYVQAMARFKAEPPTLIKDKRVGYENRDGTFTGYTHATLAEVSTKIATGLAAVGISHAWDVRSEGKMIIVSCTLTHEGGHSETVTMPAAAPDDSGKKNSIQQVASAITYMQRYSLLTITGLAAKDQDDDGAGAGEPPGLDDTQVAELEQLFKQYTVDRTGFLRWAKVDELRQIHPNSFETVKAEIVARKGPKSKNSAPITIADIRKLADQAGVPELDILRRYSIPDFDAMTAEQAKLAAVWLKNVHQQTQP
jgi:hypothetical protein